MALTTKGKAAAAVVRYAKRLSILVRMRRSLSAQVAQLLETTVMLRVSVKCLLTAAAMAVWILAVLTAVQAAVTLALLVELLLVRELRELAMTAVTECRALVKAQVAVVVLAQSVATQAAETAVLAAQAKMFQRGVANRQLRLITVVVAAAVAGTLLRRLAVSAVVVQALVKAQVHQLRVLRTQVAVAAVDVCLVGVAAATVVRASY